MKKCVKVLALVLAVLMLAAGCSVNTSKYAETWAAKYGDEITYMDEANFWLRLYQWENEGSYAYMYYYIYGVTDMWSMASGTRTQNMAQSLKENVMAQILQTYILCDKAEELKVSLTEEDKAKIDKTVAKLHEDLDPSFFTLAGSLSDSRIAEILGKAELAVKVWDAVKQQKTHVPDPKEYDEFTVKYFTIKKTAEEDQDNPLGLKVYNQALVNYVISELDNGTAPDDIYEANKDQLSFNTYSYLREDLTNVSKIRENGLKLKTGEYMATDYLESEGCWYVIYCEADHDEEMSETKRLSLIDSVQEEYFEGVYKEWAAAAKEFKVNKAFGRLKLELSYVEKPTEAASSEAASSEAASSAN